MVIAVAYDDVKSRRSWHEIRNAGGGATQTLYFGSRSEPDLPHASLNEPDPGLLSSAHFHRVDQFQVVVGGKGKIGRHDLAPYCVHFTRAYTPYGPLQSDAGDGLKFLVMRARFDAGSQHLPREREQLNSVPDRHPWQISRRVAIPALPANTAAADFALHADPEITDEQGLAVYALSMKPHAKATMPDPANGDGQYLAVLKGSVLLSDKQDKQALALIFVSPAEGPLRIEAGAEGLGALILNFPRREPAAVSSNCVKDDTDFKTWQCLLCAFVYGEAAGMPDDGIAPGTRWHDVPETWSCPDCSASKSDFERVALEKQGSAHP